MQLTVTRLRAALPALLLALATVTLGACGAAAPDADPHAHAGCFRLLDSTPAAGRASAMIAGIESPTPSPPPPAPTRRWSDAAGWPAGALPEEGDRVVIAAGEVVLLDVDTPPLAGLRIDGALVFDERDLELTSDHVVVHGGLYVGAADAPFTHRAAITLTGEPGAEGSDCFGDAYLGLVNGTVELYGDDAGPAWTRLAATAPAGANDITVDDATGWRPGDRLAIASTDFYGYAGGDAEGYDRQVEERTVTAVSGATLTLDAPLEFLHYGEDQTFGAGYPTSTLESRAEVIRLSRNVTVRGLEESADPGSALYRHGGQIMALGASSVRLDSVELTYMGQSGELMRYPVHFHLMGDAGAGSFVRNASLHHLYNRCITIHGTHGVLLERNAAYDTFGHCYFMEDGAETGNVLKGNLGLMAREPAAADRLLPTDGGTLGPSIFWITNPDNVLVGNVAASSAGSGFWYSLPEHPTGPSYELFGGASIWPRRTPLGRFDGNLAHSNASDGLHVDRGPAAGTLRAETTAYRPRANPADRDSAPVTARFENFVAYKHRSAAAWFRGDNTVLAGALLVDNAVGVTFASEESGLEHSVVVGESANLGTVMPWEEGGPDGRALPRTWDPGFAIRGFEFYDGPVFVRDSRFEAFEPNELRQAGALGILDYTDFSLSALSYAERLAFAPGTNAVRFETRSLDLLDPSSDDGNEDGYRSGLFRDADGSVTGAAGSFVTVDNALLGGAGCGYREEWNAQLCGGRYASLTLRNLDATPRELAPLELVRGADPGAAAPLHTMFGSPHGGASVPNVHFRTLLPLGHEYHYRPAGDAPAALTLELGDARPGDTLLVSLPYAGETPYVYRDWWIDARSLIPRYASLAALRSGTESGFYLGGGRLYLRLEAQAERPWAHLTVCRTAGC